MPAPPVVPSADLSNRLVANRLNDLFQRLSLDASLRSTRALLSLSSAVPMSSSSVSRRLLKSDPKCFEIFEELAHRDSRAATDVADLLLRVAGKGEGEVVRALVDSNAVSPREEDRRTESVRTFLAESQGVGGHFTKKERRAGLDGQSRRLLGFAESAGGAREAVRMRAEKLVADSAGGLAGQRFGHALRDELDGVGRYLSSVEDQTFRHARAVTLPLVYAWTSACSRRLMLLKSICEATESLRGGPLCSCLYALTLNGSSSIKALAQRLLDKVFKPLEEAAVLFIRSGRLNDPTGEFFVSKRVVRSDILRGGGGGADDEDYDDDATLIGTRAPSHHDSKFTLNKRMIPTFIGGELAMQILRAGSNANLVNRLGSSTQLAMSQALDVEERKRRDAGEFAVECHMALRLQLVLGQTESAVNATILDSLFKQHRLSDHLKALKQYMLLGQGDFGQVLIDLSFKALSRPRVQVSRMELLSFLEQAVRSSNASSSPEDVLARLDVRFDSSLTNSQGNPESGTEEDDGWGAFSLKYAMDFPLNRIVTKKSRQKYELAFRFLWRLKRASYALEATWKQHITTRFSTNVDEPVELSSLMHKCHLVRSEMIHFVTNLRSYIMFEVVETCWEQLKQDVANAKTVEDLISAHESYINDVLRKAMITHDGDEDEELSPLAASVAAAAADPSSSPFEDYSFMSAASAQGATAINRARRRGGRITALEARLLSQCLLRLFELMLRFCAVQERLFHCIAVESEARSIRRRKIVQAETDSKWGVSTRPGFAVTRPAEWEEERRNARAIATEFGERVDVVSSEFWSELGNLFDSIRASESSDLRFLVLQLDFNNFYAAT